jgi:hypothetical protein
MYFAAIGPKQQDQVTMDSDLWTHKPKPKQVFFLFKLIISGIFHSDGKLTNGQVFFQVRSLNNIIMETLFIKIFHTI